jgi:kynurenine formamidase
LAPRDFFRQAVVLDVRRQSAANADFQVRVADLERFEQRHGRIPPNAAVIAFTGWADRWGTPAYFNRDAQGNVHQPGFSLAAVRWLIRNRAIGALGTDTFGPDPGTDTQFRESSLIFHGHRIDLENMAGLEQLPPTGAWIVVGGTRNRDGSGSPATIFGLVP